MTIEDRVLKLENAFSTLVELARTQSERMDEYEHRTEELAQAQRQLTDEQRRLTEEQRRLTQGQRRLMEGQIQLTEGQIQLTGGQIQLTEGQKQTEVNMSALISVVADMGRAQLRTEQTLAALIERFDQHIGRS